MGRGEGYHIQKRADLNGAPSVRPYIIARRAGVETRPYINATRGAGRGGRLNGGRREDAATRGRAALRQRNRQGAVQN